MVLTFLTFESKLSKIRNVRIKSRFFQYLIFPLFKIVKSFDFSKSEKIRMVKPFFIIFLTF